MGNATCLSCCRKFYTWDNSQINRKWVKFCSLTYTIGLVGGRAEGCREQSNSSKNQAVVQISTEIGFC